MSESHCLSCGSCGFPMRTPADFAGGRIGAQYCGTCGDSAGQLRPYADVLRGNADYLVQEQGLDPGAATALARALLDSMPAWKGRGAAASPTHS